MKLSDIGIAIVFLAACSHVEITSEASPVLVAETCRDEGVEPNTAEFRNCDDSLAGTALVRDRMGARTPTKDRSNAISVFGGVLTDNRWYDALAPWHLDFRASRLVGLAASHRISRRNRRWSLEIEGQVVRHFGDQDNWEFNLPIVGRWEAFPWDDVVDTSLAFGIGPSYASQRPKAEVQNRGNSHHLLVYWKMEAEAGLPGKAWSAIIVLHHRSGAFNTVADEGGSNAIVVGLRRRF